MAVLAAIHVLSLLPGGGGGRGVVVGGVKWVNVTLLVDNNRGNISSLASPWGLSIYVETPSNRFLFDADGSPEVLRRNAEILGVDLSKVDFVVVSHGHGDHVGGLALIAELKPRCRVYVPAGMDGRVKECIAELGLEVVEVEDTAMVAEGVAVIGQLYGPPYEQAVAVKVEGLGLVLLVGCSHPGVENLVYKASHDLNAEVYAVIGGFHLAGASPQRLESTLNALLKQGVKKIYPVHCSGDAFRSLVESKRPELYGGGYVGLSVFFKARASG